MGVKPGGAFRTQSPLKISPLATNADTNPNVSIGRRRRPVGDFGSVSGGRDQEAFRSAAHTCSFTVCVCVCGGGTALQCSGTWLMWHGERAEGSRRGEAALTGAFLQIVHPLLCALIYLPYLICCDASP